VLAVKTLNAHTHTEIMEAWQYKGCSWMMRQPNWKSRFIPIFLHGDGTPITGIGKTWSKSSQIWNWGSLLARGSTVEVVFWIWSCYKVYLTDPARKRFWKIFVWSLRAMQRGLWPSSNWDGSDWAPGSVDAVRAGKPLVGDDRRTCFCCQLYRIKGDLEDFHEDMIIACCMFVPSGTCV
jgi:hypothetical protein